MLDYLKSKRAKSPSPLAPATTQVAEPVLTPEDEDFLARITSGVDSPASIELPPTPPPRLLNLPETGNTSDNNAQLVLLPSDQQEQSTDPDHEATETKGATDVIRGEEDKGDEKGKGKSRKPKWSWLQRDSRHEKTKEGSAGLPGAAEGLKIHGPTTASEDLQSDAEVKREQDEMAHALEQLNLAAVDNRVFSMSKETRELLSKFTLVLKDLVNGVPTAYGDLESLLTNSDDQLQRSYKHLPSWLQKLVKQLPSKMRDNITPEVLTATAEKHGLKSKLASTASQGAEKAGLKVSVPNLKDLVTKPGAVLGMLKAIMNFLKLRFPAFLGLNVLYSLALFVLLLIFWYCHKRGKEVRLEKERLATEEQIMSMEGSEASDTSSIRSLSSSLGKDGHAKSSLAAKGNEQKSTSQK